MASKRDLLTHQGREARSRLGLDIVVHSGQLLDLFPRLPSHITIGPLDLEFQRYDIRKDLSHGEDDGFQDQNKFSKLRKESVRLQG